MACALCHVDGREDGLVWELKGTFRQTPMLAGARLKDTAPYNWLRSAKTLEANIQETVAHRLDGQGLTAGELHALTRYLREGLRPVARPIEADSHRVAEGRAIFERPEVGCASCHPADFAFTDGIAHDLDSVGEGEKKAFSTAHGPVSFFAGFSPRFLRVVGSPNLKRDSYVPKKFNTPALAYLALTPPYLHDGSAPTLEALLEENHNRMGATSQLTQDERAALVAYLESL